jgi:ABC-type uncharacterized transport system YnjBCD ATPase subunit
MAVSSDRHALALAHDSGGSKYKGRGISHPERSGGKRSAGLHGGRLLGNPLCALGAEPLSVLGTCVTKQTRDMVYSEARRLRILGIWARTTVPARIRTDNGAPFAGTGLLGLSKLSLAG